MGVDRQTRGDKVPTIKELRKRGNVEGPQQTNIWDAKVAVESFDGIRGRKPLRYYIKRTVKEVKAAVRNGRMAHVCVHYGVLNDRLYRTGDPNFTGGHSVDIYGQKKRRDGQVLWLLWDPLDDARRVNIPAGPRWVPRSAVIAAMVAFGGGPDSIYAGVFAGGQKR